MADNLFDFSNTDDLPADLQKKLARSGGDNSNAEAYAEIVRKGAEAGVAEMDINQIIAVAHRMQMKVPSQQTVRDYLNRAVEIGMIVKPSRQMYALGQVQPAAGAAAKKGSKAAAAAPDAKVQSDPLAGL